MWKRRKQENINLIATAINRNDTGDNNFFKEEFIKEKTKNNNESADFSATFLSEKGGKNNNEFAGFSDIFQNKNCGKQKNNKLVAVNIGENLNDDNNFYKDKFIKEKIKNTKEFDGLSAISQNKNGEKRKNNKLIAIAIYGNLKGDNNSYKEQFIKKEMENNKEFDGFSAIFQYENYEKQKNDKLVAAAIGGILNTENNFNKERIFEEKTNNTGFSAFFYFEKCKKHRIKKLITKAIDGITNCNKGILKERLTRKIFKKLTYKEKVNLVLFNGFILFQD